MFVLIRTPHGRPHKNLDFILRISLIYFYTYDYKPLASIMLNSLLYLDLFDQQFQLFLARKKVSYTMFAQHTSIKPICGETLSVHKKTNNMDG